MFTCKFFGKQTTEGCDRISTGNLKRYSRIEPEPQGYFLIREVLKTMGKYCVPAIMAEQRLLHDQQRNVEAKHLSP
jgi:hypothetical protein